VRQAHQPEGHIWLKRDGYSRREAEVNRSLFEPRAVIIIGDQCAERCQSTGARLRPAHSFVLLTSGHHDVIRLLPAVARVSQPKPLAGDVARDVGPVALQVADQAIEGLLILGKRSRPRRLPLTDVQVGKREGAGCPEMAAWHAAVT
jgi:hypothetical protein